MWIGGGGIKEEVKEGEIDILRLYAWWFFSDFCMRVGEGAVKIIPKLELFHKQIELIHFTPFFFDKFLNNEILHLLL